MFPPKRHLEEPKVLGLKTLGFDVPKMGENKFIDSTLPLCFFFIGVTY